MTSNHEMLQVTARIGPYENPLQHADGWTNLDAVPEAAKLAGPNDTKVDGTLIHVVVPGHDLWPMWESSSYVFVACDPAKPETLALAAPDLRRRAYTP